MSEVCRSDAQNKPENQKQNHQRTGSFHEFIYEYHVNTVTNLPHLRQAMQSGNASFPIKNCSVSIPSSFKAYSTSHSAAFVQPFFRELPFDE